MEDGHLDVAEDDQELDWNALDKRKFFFFGGLLFFGVRAVVYPFGLMKTRMQVHKRNTEYVSLRNTFGYIKNQEGFWGFYRGFATTAFGIMPAQGVYLSAYEIFKIRTKEVFESTKESEFKLNLLAGMAASFCSQFVIVPVDVVAQRLMIQGDSTLKKTIVFKNGKHAFKHILMHEGIPGLYRGFLSSLLTYAPSSGIWWATYATVKRNINENTTPERQAKFSVPIQALSGLCAGGTAAILTNPMDVLKVRLQTQEGTARTSIRHTLKELIRKEGVMSLSNGLSAKIMSSAPVSVLMITVYELVKRLSLKEEYK